MWGEMFPIFNFCKKFFWPIRRLVWLDKNIFHWRFETGLENDFIMNYLLQGLWIVKIVSCFCPVLMSTCHKWELLITCTYRPLCFKKITTITATIFLISNTVVPNPYSHCTSFDPQSYLKLSILSCTLILNSRSIVLIDLSQANTQYFTAFK